MRWSVLTFFQAKEGEADSASDLYLKDLKLFLSLGVQCVVRVLRQTHSEFEVHLDLHVQSQSHM